MSENLSVGDVAPDFQVINENSTFVSFKDLVNKNIVLYFYPKDNTPGCTIEANDFSILTDDFAKEDAVILGVSKDSVKSHQNFIKKQNIKFNLLADIEGKMVLDYGVWVEKSMYGKKYMGIERATFLIGKDKKILNIWRNVKVKNHAQDVLDVLKQVNN